MKSEDNENREQHSRVHKAVADKKLVNFFHSSPKASLAPFPQKKTDMAGYDP